MSETRTEPVASRWRCWLHRVVMILAFVFGGWLAGEVIGWLTGSGRDPLPPPGNRVVNVCAAVFWSGLLWADWRQWHRERARCGHE
ncbi:hypothetical protein I5Q34_08225 [Streptomyces sp. AV19]|uniref:hypothetical protein n=1 Tax=Streptomyces sp. AV19 TaxID=2793068 RepID=UPI0018FE3703|nr:hypothetical protein [Streptomyces sp. AV19]MBH1934281.1 hypothetical protein [Streptomyces sp. AV19]MDG4533409.1 hypothetical protein [Streptomyces sp. AV19]